MPKTVNVGAHALVTATITRPANTTQYASGDIVTDTTGTAGAIEFSDCARVGGGGGRVTHAIVSSSANQGTKPTLKLYLFDDEPTSEADNELWDPTDAEVADILGVITLAQANWETAGYTAGTSGSSFIAVTGLNIPFECEAGSTDLYGLLVERATYAPVSGEVFTIRLGVEQD